MLLNKRILICCVLFLLFASLVSAEVCEVDRIKQVLKKILFLYYTEPSSVPLTKDEVKDMLVFYLSINDQNITVDCSAFGSRSNKPLSDVLNAGENVADKIPSCTDGTKYGECSKIRPAYCYAGAIYSRCGLCGCPTNSVCGKSGKCESTSQNITCFKDIDCGQISPIGSYYCVNNNIVRDILNYSCTNPGTTNSKCAVTNRTVWLTYCNPNLNQTCVAGQNYCKVPVANVSTTTTNQTNQTFSGILTIKGRLIDYFTKQPIANGLIFTWDSQTARRDTYTNSNGEFSTTADTTQVTTTTAKSFGIQPNCYNNMGMGLFRNSDNNLYVNVQINQLIGAAKSFAVTGSEVNVGDIPMWPAVDIQINSDIAVKFNLEYNGLTGSGNSLYKTLHYLSYSFPLTVDTRAKLTDQANNVYYSPYLNVPLSNGCKPVNLNFFNKQFAWNASGQTNVSNASNCFVKIDGVVVKSVYATDRNDCYSKTSFGSINCNTYAPYFTEGVHFLEQYFGANDRVNNEYCTCSNGVCVQGNQTAQNITLHSLAVNGSNLEAAYSKNFDTCVHLLTSTSTTTHTQNYFCTQGSYIKTTAPLSGFTVNTGQSYKLCHGNNYNICSGLKSLANVTTTSQTTSCTDSDGGQDIYVKGTTSYKACPTCYANNVTDFCSNNYVTEGWCGYDPAINGIGRYQASYLCTNGCLDGACIGGTPANQTNVSFKCTDSDNGLNYYIYGTTNGYRAYGIRNSSNTVTEKDSCTTVCSGSVGSGIGSTGQCLLEYYCDSIDYAAFNVYTCPYGCQNAVCINQTTTQPNYSITVITPNGGQYWESGRTYSIVWTSSNLPAGNNIAIELTKGLATAQLLFTNLPNTATSVSWTVPYNIATDSYKIRVIYVTNTGAYAADDYSDNSFTVAYLAQASTNITIQGSDGTWCYDPDGYGYVDTKTKKYCKDDNGTYEDYCESSTLLRDWYCTGTWNGASWSNVKCAAGGYGCSCSSGACS